jgi:hypothetical protein
VRTKDGIAYGGAESFPIFRTSWEPLDRRQLSDTPFHRIPVPNCGLERAGARYGVGGIELNYRRAMRSEMAAVVDEA